MRGDRVRRHRAQGAAAHDPGPRAVRRRRARPVHLRQGVAAPAGQMVLVPVVTFIPAILSQTLSGGRALKVFFCNPEFEKRRYCYTRVTRVVLPGP